MLTVQEGSVLQWNWGTGYTWGARNPTHPLNSHFTTRMQTDHDAEMGPFIRNERHPTEESFIIYYTIDR